MPPISVTGTWIPRKALRAARRQGGFTLFELLVVVTIIVITFSLIQLSPSLGDNNRELKQVGKDLGKMFRLLNQEAVFENRNYAVSVRDDGFLILEYADGAWNQSDDRFFKRIKLSDSQHSRLIIENQQVDTSTKRTPEPQILILSSGEMTPFEWRIEDSRTNSRIVLQGNMLGSVLMTGPEPLS